MDTRERDTIFALASGRGRAGIAVIRISGPRADHALEALTDAPLPAPRHAVIRTLIDKTNGSRIDVGLVLRFPAPGSYTGEDVVEIHTHGGRAVVAAVLLALSGQAGLRPAEAGEFTRRAVENGHLDLIQAEAVADLVNAETDAQRRQALRQFDGELSALYEEWRSRLIRSAAWFEAAIDFPDEEIPDAAIENASKNLAAIRDGIRAHLSDGRRGEILRDGVHIAVVGPPNAGKSSLVNALAQRDVAIVSEIPGTTRDIIEVHLDVGGYPVILADTAGLRESADVIEREGVRRARARARTADLRLLVLDGADPQPGADLVPGMKVLADITVWNKADLMPLPRSHGLWVSAKTGEGMDRLIECLSERAREMEAGTPVLTRTRHRHALEQAAESLDAALASQAASPELVAENVRRALGAIGRITGRVDIEELLDVVFRDFCIGK